jgi:mono/diheme cytochrome c family protein
VEIFNTTFTPPATTYTLNAAYTDGTSETFSDSFTGLNQTFVHTIKVNQAGGITLSLNSTAAATLVLRQGATALSSTATSVNPSISLPRFNIDQIAYAQAYYAAIDPGNNKDTLAKWKTTNGFGPCDYEVRFRDVHDLGYGRHMCWRRDALTGDIAVWVENFQVKAVPGQNYGPLNLEAVVNDDRRWHISTNAIEYSAGPGGGAKFVKFYTFTPAGERKLLTNLDGRGDKAMPIVCISCHGGRAEPLLAVPQTVSGTAVTSTFPTIGNAVGSAERGSTLAHMQPLNVDTLDFSSKPSFRRVDQEATLKGINQLVLCSYPILSTAPVFTEDSCRVPVAPAVWSGVWQSTTAEMIKAWYDTNGDGHDMESPTFSDTYVPLGWKEPAAGGTAPAGATNLYQTVVAPNCRVCHALRGNGNFNVNIDFFSYAKFINFEDRIKYHVFDKGNMPLALLKYNDFWSSGAPTILAAVISGAKDVNGNVLHPTRPVANPGPGRVVRAGSVKLSAAESVNAVSYRWSVASGACTLAPDQVNLTRPTLSASGDCTVELTVNDGSRDSDPVTLTIVVSPTAPSGTRFTDIRSILQDTTTLFCTSCHTNTGGVAGIPVYYTNYDRAGTGVVAGTDLPNVHQFYLDIRARINFTNIESSRLLRRPSGHQHPGGLLPGFNNSLAPGNSSRSNYDIFLNWILDGAPE